MPKIASTLVEVCICSGAPDRPAYLLLKRSPDDTIYPGLWQFVSGSIHEGEKAPDAALRELLEETGLRPGSFWVVPHVSVFYDPSHDSMNLVSVFGARVSAGAVPKLSPEHTEYLWCDYETARGRLVWPGQREGLRIFHEFIVRGEGAAPISRLF